MYELRRPSKVTVDVWYDDGTRIRVVLDDPEKRGFIDAPELTLLGEEPVTLPYDRFTFARPEIFKRQQAVQVVTSGMLHLEWLEGPMPDARERGAAVPAEAARGAVDSAVSGTAHVGPGRPGGPTAVSADLRDLREGDSPT